MELEPGEVKKSSLQSVVEMVNLSELSSRKGIISALISAIPNPRSTVNQLKEMIQLDPPLIDVKPYALDLIFKAVRKEFAKMEDKGLL